MKAKRPRRRSWAFKFARAPSQTKRRASILVGDAIAQLEHCDVMCFLKILVMPTVPVGLPVRAAQTVDAAAVYLTTRSPAKYRRQPETSCART